MITKDAAQHFDVAKFLLTCSPNNRKGNGILSPKSTAHNTDPQERVHNRPTRMMMGRVQTAMGASFPATLQRTQPPSRPAGPDPRRRSPGANQSPAAASAAPAAAAAILTA